MAEKRDKPYLRTVTVDRSDESRLKEILDNIEREDVINAGPLDAGLDKVSYVVSINKEELLLLRLTFPAKAKKVRKPKKKKTKKTFRYVPF